MGVPVNASEKLSLLQRTSCIDKIAWSKNGAIAYTTGDSVKICHLTCTNGQTWKFSTPVSIPNISSIHSSSPVVHLSWSCTGTDLACVDEKGDVSIFSIANGGQMHCLLQPQPDQRPPTPRELDGIIALKWLEPEKPILLSIPAVRNPQPSNDSSSSSSTNSVSSSSSGMTTYGLIQGKLCGPYHPLQAKQACVALTRSGQLKLFAQIATDVRYYQVEAILDSTLPKPSSIPNIALSLFSHASFAGCKDNSLFLAVYSSRSQMLECFKVSINWNFPSSAMSKASPSSGSPVSNSSTTSSEFATLQSSRVMTTSLIKKSNKLLSHLLVVSPVPQKSSSDTEQPHVFIVYSNFSGSVVERYSIVKRSVALHSNFYSLGLRSSRDSFNGNSGDDIQTELILKDSVALESPLLTLTSACYDTFMCFALSSGSILLKYQGQSPVNSSNNTNGNGRNGSISSGGNNNVVVSLSDTGFVFPNIVNASDMCISPNLVSYVRLVPGKDGDVQLDINYMSNPSVSKSPSYDDLSLVAVGLSIRHSISCFGNICNDDIYVVMKKELERIQDISPELGNQFLTILLKESHRAINFTLDVPKDYQFDKIIVNPSLQRMLSMQLSLGSYIDWQRNILGRISWCVLNLRLLAFALTFTLRAANQTKPNIPVGTSEIEVKANNTLSMLGLIRWCLDLIVFICQELYLASLQNPFERSGNDFVDSFYGAGKSRLPSVSMAVLLGKIPRMLLIHSLRGIRALEQLAGKLSEQEQNNNSNSGSYHSFARIAHRRLKEVISLVPVPLITFEKLVNDIDNTMRNMYPTLRDRLGVEQNLMFQGLIPTDLSNVVKRIVEAFTKSFKPEISLSNMFFHETDWLELHAPPNEPDVCNITSDTNLSPLDLKFTNASKHSRYANIDALRKQFMSKTPASNRTRRCVRCGSCSEWDEPKPIVFTQWTVAFQKNCLCGGTWIR